MDFSDDWRVLRISDEPYTIECEFYLTNQIFLVSIGNGLVVEQYKILRHLFTIQPEAMTFYHFIRHWIIEKCVCSIEPKHLLLLVVFFLQRDGFMPSLFDVFLNVPKLTIDGKCLLVHINFLNFKISLIFSSIDNQVQYDENRTLRSYNLKRIDYYRKHVLAFFEYYRSFDFYYYILNIHRGYKMGLKKYRRHLKNSAALNIIFVEHEKNFTPNTKFYQLTDFTNICNVSHKLFENFYIWN